MDAHLVRVAANDTDALLGDGDAVRRAIARAENDAARHLDIGETWAALHFLLSGETPIPRHEALARGAGWDDDSLENVLMGGEPTPFGASFGPARLVAPSDVASLADKLSQLDSQRVLARYHASELEEEQIPPHGWTGDHDRLEWLRDALSRLMAFFHDAAAAGDGLLVYLI